MEHVNNVQFIQNHKEIINNVFLIFVKIGNYYYRQEYAKIVQRMREHKVTEKNVDLIIVIKDRKY